MNGCLRLRGNARAIDQALIQYNSRAMFKALGSQVEQLEAEIRGLGSRLLPAPSAAPSKLRRAAHGMDGGAPPGFCS